MRKITKELLIKAGACPQGLAAFTKKFPNGLIVNKENVTKNWDYIRKKRCSVVIYWFYRLGFVSVRKYQDWFDEILCQHSRSERINYFCNYLDIKD